MVKFKLTVDLPNYKGMEAWAQDLATALDESSHCPIKPKLFNYNQLTKQGLGLRRRTKSTGNLVDHSIETSSSEGGMDDHERAHSSVHQTETDDGSTKEKVGTCSTTTIPSFAIPSSHLSIFGCWNQAKVNFTSPDKQVTQTPSLAESDSVNETVSPMRPYTRRKRRFKRMAVDPEPRLVAGIEENCEPQSSLCRARGFSFSTFASSSIFAKPRQRKSRRKPINLNKMPTFSIGKRKRSTRERSIECELEKISLNSTPESETAANHSAICGNETTHDNSHLIMDSMDLDTKQMEQVSSSSVSGSESDPGFYTNDDGREADDEQSDWYQESGPSWGVPGIKAWWDKDSTSAAPFRPPEEDIDGEDTEEEANCEGKKSPQFLRGSWKHLSDEAKDPYRLRMQKLRDRIPGREIRAGRRHLGEQRGPAVSILTSANEKLSRFLQDPAQSELRLHPMQKSERDQLSHLATLYSLQMRSEGARGLKCPVLKKTSNTMQAVRIDMDRSPSLWSDFKRQKKTPPASVTSESGVMEDVPSMDENNINNQLLRSTGWASSSVNGSEGVERISPNRATVRPKYLGLGLSEGNENSDTLGDVS